MTHCRPIFWLITSFLLLTAACAPEERTLCYSYRAVDAKGWEQHDGVTFNSDTVRISGNYAITVGLRTTAAYPFPTGRNHGHGVSIFEQLCPLKQVHMETGQTVTVSINHIMRRVMLPGITDVGLIIRKE